MIVTSGGGDNDGYPPTHLPTHTPPYLYDLLELCQLLRREHAAVDPCVALTEQGADHRGQPTPHLWVTCHSMSQHVTGSTWPTSLNQ